MNLKYGFCGWFVDNFGGFKILSEKIRRNAC